MNVKNYTSTVPAMNSAAAIEALLIEAGASSISKWYEEKQPIGFLFQLPVNGTSLTFRLPAQAAAVTNLMLAKKPKANAQQRGAIRAQAYRTAWRTLHEWVQIQVTMILIQQVEPMQVFLPYVYNETSGSTFYDHLKAGGFKQLGA